MQRKILKKKVSAKIKDGKLVNKRHEQIFRAASRLIQEKGYHRTTLRNISKETGISLGNLYDYITTKEDILYIVHEKAARMVAKSLDGAINEFDEPAEKLKVMVEKELETMDKYQDLIMSIYQETHALSKPSIRSMLRSEEAHTGRFRKILEEGIAKGVFKRCNTVALSNIIKMMIDCWVLRRWALRGKVSLDENEAGDC